MNYKIQAFLQGFSCLVIGSTIAKRNSGFVYRQRMPQLFSTFTPTSEVTFWRYRNPCFSLRLLASTLWPRSTLDSLSCWSVQVMCRNPALIVSLCARGHRRPIGSKNGYLVSGIDLLRLAGGPLGPFAAFTSTSFLRKERDDPGAVYKVTCSSEQGS